jgi:post-segregation antitoxin (ccd killing protein)
MTGTCRLCDSTQLCVKGLCTKHYQQVRRGSSVTIYVDGELALAAEARGQTASQFVHAAVVAALDVEAKRRGVA